jgi:hypothetical protein
LGCALGVLEHERHLLAEDELKFPHDASLFQPKT